MIDSINIAVETIAILWCLAGLFGEKLKINRWVIGIVTINIIIFNGINNYNFPNILSTFSYIFIFLFCMLEYHDSIQNTVIRYIAGIIVMTPIQLASYGILNILYINPLEPTEYDSLATNVLTLIIVMIIMKTGLIKKTIDFVMSYKKVLLVIFFSLGFIVLRAILNLKEGDALENFDAFEMMFFVFLFFVVLREWQKAQEEAKKKQQQLEMNALYSDAFEELIALVRERQHDMKSHIDAILGMIYTTKSYDELVQRQKEYCTDISDYSKESKILLCVENPLIAGFLYKKVQEIYAREIEVEYDLAMSKRKLKISEYELIEIIGILTDNAIEEVEKEKSGKIKIQIRETAEEVKIIVANTSTLTDMEQISKMFGKNYSSKGVGRGIGLPKLKKMVENNKGTIEISNEEDAGDNLLQFQIVLPV